MSMTRSTGNVVPFDTTTPPPTTPPWPPGPWPFPPTMMPGCAPPGGMDNLMGCYWSVQQATAFISAIMIDAINNNPAVAEAMIAAIEKSGSTLPLLGVTNGSLAQPGQVGENILWSQQVNYPVTAGYTQTVTMGVLQPGDWECQIYAYEPTTTVTALNIVIQPAPTTTVGVAQAFVGSLPGTTEFLVLVSPIVQIYCSTPQLIPILVLTNQSGAGTAAGSVGIYFTARRMR